MSPEERRALKRALKESMVDVKRQKKSRKEKQNERHEMATTHVGESAIDEADNNDDAQQTAPPRPDEGKKAEPSSSTLASRKRLTPSQRSEPSSSTLASRKRLTPSQRSALLECRSTLWSEFRSDQMDVLELDRLRSFMKLARISCSESELRDMLSLHGAGDGEKMDWRGFCNVFSICKLRVERNGHIW
eukprot:GHVO01016875.1.p1 GENE.GHVO01016875.1~~GHVO01016875.1.p1  ORF type:complete len:189 (+),score=27.99 GHVO01016875.1:123-689(+)